MWGVRPVPQHPAVGPARRPPGLHRLDLESPRLPPARAHGLRPPRSAVLRSRAAARPPASYPRRGDRPATSRGSGSTSRCPRTSQAMRFVHEPCSPRPDHVTMGTMDEMPSWPMAVAFYALAYLAVAAWVPLLRGQTYKYKSPSLLGPPGPPSPCRSCVTYPRDRELFGLGDREGGGMPRRLRVQFEGATYHVMSRGNGRQDIVVDDRDRRHFVASLGAQVGRSGWELISFRFSTVRLRELCRALGYGRPASIAGILGRLEGGGPGNPGSPGTWWRSGAGCGPSRIAGEPGSGPREDSQRARCQDGGDAQFARFILLRLISACF